MKFVMSLYYLHSVVQLFNLVFFWSIWNQKCLQCMVYIKITFDSHTLNFRKERFENLEKICRYVFQNYVEILKKLPKNFEIGDSK